MPQPTALRPGPCRVVNPDTGAEIGQSVQLEKIEGELAWVQISPSIRPGLPYDRATYPLAWIQQEPPRPELARFADTRQEGVSWIIEPDPILYSGFLIRRIERHPRSGDLLSDAIVEGEIEARSEAIARAADLSDGGAER